MRGPIRRDGGKPSGETYPGGATGIRYACRRATTALAMIARRWGAAMPSRLSLAAYLVFSLASRRRDSPNARRHASAPQKTEPAPAEHPQPRGGTSVFPPS